MAVTTSTIEVAREAAADQWRVVVRWCSKATGASPQPRVVGGVGGVGNAEASMKAEQRSEAEVNLAVGPTAPAVGSTGPPSMQPVGSRVTSHAVSRSV